MKLYFNKFAVIILTLLVTQLNFSQNTISSDDLTMIVGDWNGSLTYMDYSTNKPYTMPANVTVSVGKNEYQAQLFFNYPKEPNANSKDKIRISEDGLQINKNKVISRELLPNGEVAITTEYSGRDNNKKALIRDIYILGPIRFVIRKEVKFDTGEKWLLRNEYRFTR